MAGVFMRISDGATVAMQGSATQKGHEGWIEVNSVGFGSSPRFQGGFSGASAKRGRASGGAFFCVKSIDQSTPRFNYYSQVGTPFDIRIDFPKSDDDEYLSMFVFGAVVVRQSFEGNASEAITFSFSKVTSDMYGKSPDISLRQANAIARMTDTTNNQATTGQKSSANNDRYIRQ
jgi:type VI protein secretion system component Hcp